MQGVGLTVQVRAEGLRVEGLGLGLRLGFRALGLKNMCTVGLLGLGFRI